MKNLPIVINVSLCAALILGLVIFGLPGAKVRAADETATPTTQATSTQAAKIVCDGGRTVQVSGSAVVNVVPDRVLILLGIQSNSMTINDVEFANTSATESVFAVLKTMKIEPKDISTDQYIIEPVYSSYDSLNIKGYRISNSVAITLRDVSKVSEVISNALKAGANQVINVEFYTSSLRKYRDQARDMAIKAAHEKAQALAYSAGAEAGCVIHINENSWSSYYGGYGRSQNTNSQNVSQNAGLPSGSASGDDGPVSLGQIAVQANVDMTFALK